MRAKVAELRLHNIGCGSQGSFMGGEWERRKEKEGEKHYHLYFNLQFELDLS